MKIVYIGWCEIINTQNLTKNKTYVCTYETPKYYEILDDKGYLTLHEKYNFVTLAEIRDQRINSILN